MLEIEKRVMHEERRPPPPEPGHTYVEGLAAIGVQLLDWNDDLAQTNGFWFSRPGALNTPDPSPPVTATHWFVGNTIVDADGFGLQWATEHRPPSGDTPTRWPPASYVRRFYEPVAGGQVAFSTWASQDGVLVGTIIMWPRAAAPAGYLYLDGSVYDPLLYPDLFVLLSNVYGGTTAAPLLPDMRSRFPIGSGTFAGVSVTEGLAEALRSPVHEHGIPGALNHSHGAGSLVTATASNTTVTGSGLRSQNPITGTTDPAGAHDHSGTTLMSDVTAIPFMGVKFCIKAL